MKAEIKKALVNSEEGGSLFQAISRERSKIGFAGESLSLNGRCKEQPVA
jgi:hypothetical protein